MTTNPKQLASPYSTGDGGGDLQSQVGAYYLAGLLLRHVPRGLDAGTLSEVRFQRLYEGLAVDDLVCVADTPGGTAKLALQIKNDLTFGERDALFAEVMTACWQTYNSTRFDRARDRFGIALGVYQSKVDQHYQTVLTWARNSTTAAGFLERISKKRLAHENHREFVRLVRGKLTATKGSPVGDEELWGFLRAMVVLHFDLQTDGSRDRTHTVNSLRDALQPGAGPGAEALYPRLMALSAEANRTAGEYTRDTLVGRIAPEGYSFAASPDCRDDLARLGELRDHILADIRTDVAGLTLNRIAATEAAEDGFEEAALLLLVGPPGVGKSGIWKALVEKHRLAGPVLVLSADRLDGKGWPGFARTLGLTRTAEEIVRVVSGHPRPCIFIDGIDRINDPGARLAVNDLLRAVEKVLPSTRARRWWCVATAREGGLERLGWLDRVARGVATARVPELADEEVKLVLERHPRLRPLLGQVQLQPVLTNPFFLDLIADDRMAPAAGGTIPLTEVEVGNVWWERLVGPVDSTAGRERQQMLAAAAERLIGSGRRRFADAGLPAGALASLETDRILTRDHGQNVCRFAHDLLEDWALVRVLEQHREDLTGYLKGSGQPHGLLRAVGLLACTLLERGNTADEWAALLAAVEAAEGLAPRWRQAVLTAPFLSTRVGELLDRAREVLFAGDGERLRDLLLFLRTSEVDPDPSMNAAVARVAKTPEDAFALAVRFPLPRWYVWFRTIDWLLRNTGDLDGELEHEATRVMEIWQEKSGPGAPLRREIGLLIETWLRRAEED
jgi:hypothetical protein